MARNIEMPQMGESVAEGTIVRWLKEVGDSVDRYEPIFEITTDKVDAEIPAPEGGVLLEIKVGAGETVEVGTIVAVIGEAGEAVSASSDNAPEEASQSETTDAPPVAASNAPAPAASAPVPAASGEILSCVFFSGGSFFDICTICAPLPPATSVSGPGKRSVPSG